MEELIPFSGGLNKDDELLQPGDYRDANNIILTSDIDQEEGGSIRGIKTMDSLGSNEDIDTLVSGSGVTQTYADALVDNEDDDIVYILMRVSTTVHILKYVISTDTATIIVTYAANGSLRDSGSAIDNRFFFKLLGDLLITNYSGDGAVICIPKTSSGLYQPTREEMSILGQSPTTASSLSITGTDFSSVFSERGWQFAHRFTYADGRISSLSPFSDIIGLQEADEVNTNISEVQVSITETWDTQIPPSKIEVFVREADIGTWRRCKTFNSITSGVANTFNWSGQRFETLSTDYATSIFNFAPRYAKNGEIVDNRLFLGNVKFFDDDESGTLSVAIASGTGLEFASGDYTASFASGVGTSSYRPFTNNSTYRIGVIGMDDHGRTRGVEDEAEFNTGDFGYPIIPSITISASGTLPSWMTKYQVVVSQSQTKDYFFEGLASAVYYLSVTDDGEYYSTTKDKDTEYLVVDIKDLFKENIVYSFNQGDQIRGKFGGSTVQQVDIISQRGSRLLCRVPSDSSYTYDASTNYDLLFFEIISPAQETDNFIYYGTGVINVTSGLPDTVNVDGDSFVQYKSILFSVGDYLVKKSGRVSVSEFTASGTDVVEFDTEDFLPDEIIGISSYLKAGDNSGFYAESEATLRFNAKFTVDSYTGSGSVSVISRDPTDTSVASGELVGAKSIDLNTFISAAGPDGSMTVTGSALTDCQLVKIDTTNTVMLYTSYGDSSLYAQLFNINGGIVTANGSRVLIDSGGNISNSFSSKELDAFLIDSTHVCFLWTQGTSGGNGYTRMYTIDTGAGTLTATGAEFTFHAGSTSEISADLIDSTNAIIWYGSGDINGQLVTLNTGTGTITANGSVYSIPSSNGEDTNLDSYVISTTRAVVCFTGTNDGYVQMFTLDTGAGTITSTGSSYNYDTSVDYSRIEQIDSSNAFLVWDDGGLKALLLSTDTGTGAITANGAVESTSISSLKNISIDYDGTNIAGIYTDSTTKEVYVFGFSFDTASPSITLEEFTGIDHFDYVGSNTMVSTDAGKFQIATDGDNSSENQAITQIYNVGSGAGDYSIKGEISITQAGNICLAVSATTITVSNATLELGYASDYTFDPDGGNKKFTFVDTQEISLDLAMRSVNLTSRNAFWRKGLGKPFVDLEEKNLNEYLQNRIYFGQKYIKGTNVNPFNYFYFDDAEEIPFEVGPINALVNTSSRSSSPGTLLAICDRKPVSIYVGANIITNTDGSTSLITSDRVINGVNVLAGDHGITQRDPLVSYDGQVFWRDSSRNGSICRYSREGVVRISDNKMKSYFNSRKISAGGMEYDPYYDMLLVTTGTQTVGYSNGRWVSFYGDREFSGNTTGGVCSVVINDKIHTFEDASGTLLAKASLGSDQACDITLAKHTMRPIEPKYIGIVMTGMSANNPLSGATDTDFSVVIQNEKGQLSTLTNYDFIIEDQDYLYADVMADEGSSGGKLNGEQIVGSKHTIKLNIPSGDLVRLVVLGSEPSLGHF